MKFYMAPLQSYTTSFYRKAHASAFGAMDKYFTPFFEDTGKLNKQLIFKPELDNQLNEHLNVVPQIATNDALFLLYFAEEMQKRGFKELNINMGCPFPMLVKRKRGGGLLGHPKTIQQLLNAFDKANLNIKLSVKMRLGIDTIQQGLEVLTILNDFKLEELILHPRLVIQKYSGVPDWGSLEQFHNLSRHRIVANGDINSYSDLVILNKHFPAIDSFMIGRGLLTNPGLYTKLIHGNSPSDITAITNLHQHYFSLITSYYKDWNQAFNFLHSFWHYPLSSSIDKQRHLRKLKKYNKPDLYTEWLKTINSLF